MDAIYWQFRSIQFEEPIQSILLQVAVELVRRCKAAVFVYLSQYCAVKSDKCCCTRSFFGSGSVQIERPTKQRKIIKSHKIRSMHSIRYRNYNKYDCHAFYFFFYSFKIKIVFDWCRLSSMIIIKHRITQSSTACVRCSPLHTN